MDERPVPTRAQHNGLLRTRAPGSFKRLLGRGRGGGRRTRNQAPGSTEPNRKDDRKVGIPKGRTGPCRWPEDGGEAQADVLEGVESQGWQQRRPTTQKERRVYEGGGEDIDDEKP